MSLELFALLRARLAYPQRIHDMARHQVKPVPKVNPVATQAQVAVAEAQLGFALPPLLKQLYTQIGNGGFGPGYGLYPLDELVATYTNLQEDNPYHPDGYWPANLLEICTWGCAIGTCIDYTLPAAPVFLYDPEWHVLDSPNLTASVTDAHGQVLWEYQAVSPPVLPALPLFRVQPQRPSLEALLQDWAAGADLWGEFYGR